MKVPVVMPQLGLTMLEGSVNEWLKKPGDTIRKGDMLFVVSTEKADMEVESLDEGALTQIVVEPGRVVPVGTVIAYLEGPGGGAVSQPPPPPVEVDVATPPPAVQKEAAAVEQVSPATSVPQPQKEGLPASPRARKLARELGVDISKLTPAGGDGRIIEADVRRFAESVRAQVAGPIPLDLRRRHVIVERLTKSIQTIPHFSLGCEVRADQLVAVRESLKGPVQQQTGLKLTVTDLLLKAMGMALEETPPMRAVWVDGSGPKAAPIDLGLAIAADSGVVAPVIRNVGTLDVAEIARWRKPATEKARGGKLSLADLEGGVGTLSNLGMYRVNQFQAIISPGQSFILAVGKIAQRPWVEAGALMVAQTLTLTLSVDHRVADGAVAAQFLEKISAIVENPYRLLWKPA